MTRKLKNSPLKKEKEQNGIITITLRGRIPSKKNSKIMVCRGKFPVLLPSSKYTEWHKIASLQLPKQPEPIASCWITARFYFPDNRVCDLGNKFESLADLLVDNNILLDDSWQVVHDLDLIACGVDKEDPRVEITINRTDI